MTTIMTESYQSRAGDRTTCSTTLFDNKIRVYKTKIQIMYTSKSMHDRTIPFDGVAKTALVCDQKNHLLGLW
jgi:hypothetical protein